jgi:hypothetical protein
MPGTATRCPFCTTWLDLDVRRKVDGDFLAPSGSMSTTTLGTSNVLREKDSIEVLTSGHASYNNQSLSGAQMGTYSGMANNLGTQSALGVNGMGAGGINSSGVSIHSDTSSDHVVGSSSAKHTAHHF